MRLSNVKSMLVKAAMVGVVAGAFAMVAPAKAAAQGVSVGVQFGRPAYSGYYEPRHDYYEPRHDYYERMRFEQARREAFERQQAYLQQAYLRHEQRERWEREHRGFYGRDRFDRRDRFDHDDDGRRDWDRR